MFIFAEGNNTSKKGISAGGETNQIHDWHWEQDVNYIVPHDWWIPLLPTTKLITATDGRCCPDATKHIQTIYIISKLKHPPAFPSSVFHFICSIACKHVPVRNIAEILLTDCMSVVYSWDAAHWLHGCRFSVISWREQITYWCTYNDICFVPTR